MKNEQSDVCKIDPSINSSNSIPRKITLAGTPDVAGTLCIKNTVNILSPLSTIKDENENDPYYDYGGVF